MRTRWESGHARLVAEVAPTLRRIAIDLRLARLSEAAARGAYHREDTWATRAAWLAARRTLRLVESRGAAEVPS